MIAQIPEAALDNAVLTLKNWEQPQWFKHNIGPHAISRALGSNHPAANILLGPPDEVLTFHNIAKVGIPPSSWSTIVLEPFPMFTKLEFWKVGANMPSSGLARKGSDVLVRVTLKSGETVVHRGFPDVTFDNKFIGSGYWDYRYSKEYFNDPLGFLRKVADK
jgi:hypothetical protein